MNIHHLNETRNAKIEALKALGSNPDQSAFNALEAEVRALDVQIGNARKIEAFERAAPADEKFNSEVRGKYSLSKAIREAAEGRGLTGFEAEASAELAKRAGGGEERGIRIPMSVLAETRDFTVANPASAGNTVQNQYGELVGALFPQAKVIGMGATVISGLRGDFVAPRQLDGAAIKWIDENEAAGNTDVSFDNITMKPHTASARMVLSRRILLQNGVSLEQLLKADLARAIAAEIDRVALVGLGTPASKEPKGLKASLTAIVPGDPTDISDIAADILGSVALENDTTSGFLATTSVMNLARKVKDSTGRSISVAEQFHGIRTEETNQVADKLIFGGNWSALAIGIYDSLSMIIDPYSLSATGQLALTTFADCDVALRHPKSLAYATVTSV